MRFSAIVNAVESGGLVEKRISPLRFSQKGASSFGRNGGSLVLGGFGGKNKLRRLRFRFEGPNGGGGS
jgi:hypothetical protein